MSRQSPKSQSQPFNNRGITEYTDYNEKLSDTCKLLNTCNCGSRRTTEIRPPPQPCVTWRRTRRRRWWGGESKYVQMFSNSVKWEKGEKKNRERGDEHSLQQEGNSSVNHHSTVRRSRVLSLHGEDVMLHYNQLTTRWQQSLLGHIEMLKKWIFFIANLCFLHFSWKTIKTEVKQDAMKHYLQTLTEYLEVLQIK